MAYKFCPECGFKLDKPYKFCPECGYKLDVQSQPKVEPTFEQPVAKQFEPSFSQKVFAQQSQQEEILDQFELQQKQQDEYNKTLLKAKIFSKREQFENAEKVYEELLINDPKDANAFIGFVRVASKNFKEIDTSDTNKALDSLFEVANTNSVFEEEQEFNDFLAKKGLLESWQTKTGYQKSKIKLMMESQHQQVYKKLFGEDKDEGMFSANAIKRLEREKAVDEYIKKHGKTPQDFMCEMAKEKADQIARQQKLQFEQKIVDAKTWCLKGQFDKAQSLFAEILAVEKDNVTAHVGMFRIATKGYTLFDGKLNADFDSLVKRFGKECLHKEDGEISKVDVLQQKFLQEQQKEMQRLWEVEHAEEIALQQSLQKQQQKEAKEKEEAIRYAEADKIALKKFAEEGAFAILSKGTKDKAEKVSFGMWPQRKKPASTKIYGKSANPNFYVGSDENLYYKHNDDYFRLEKLTWLSFGGKSYFCEIVLDIVKYNLKNSTSYANSGVAKYLSDTFKKMAFVDDGAKVDVSIPQLKDLKTNRDKYKESDYFKKTWSDYFRARDNEILLLTGRNYFWTRNAHEGKVVVVEEFNHWEHTFEPTRYAGVVPVISINKTIYDNATKK